MEIVFLVSKIDSERRLLFLSIIDAKSAKRCVERELDSKNRY